MRAKLSYAGQSLGGILGSLYSAAAPEVKNAALNVPGGGLTNIILTSPAFAQLKTAFQAGLAAEGVQTNSPLYDTFLGIVQWIVDPGDPLNAGPYLVRDTRPGTFDPTTNPLANNGSSSARLHPVDRRRSGRPEPDHRGPHPGGHGRSDRDRGAGQSQHGGAELLGEAVRVQREPGRQPRLPARVGRWGHRAGRAG